MSDNVTKEGVEVSVGQVWRDLDKRMNGRCVKVVSVSFGRARVARCNPETSYVSDNQTTLSIRRMHKGSTGWALVTPNAKVSGPEAALSPEGRARLTGSAALDGEGNDDE